VTEGSERLQWLGCGPRWEVPWPSHSLDTTLQMMGSVSCLLATASLRVEISPVAGAVFLQVVFASLAHAAKCILGWARYSLTTIRWSKHPSRRVLTTLGNRVRPRARIGVRTRAVPRGTVSSRMWKFHSFGANGRTPRRPARVGRRAGVSFSETPTSQASGSSARVRIRRAVGEEAHQGWRRHRASREDDARSHHSRLARQLQSLPMVASLYYAWDGRPGRSGWRAYRHGLGDRQLERSAATPHRRAGAIAHPICGSPPNDSQRR
jgi:hypothetical protein